MNLQLRAKAWATPDNFYTCIYLGMRCTIQKTLAWFGSIAILCGIDPEDVRFFCFPNQEIRLSEGRLHAVAALARLS